MMTEWKPIETAPEDSEILLWDGKGIYIGECWPDCRGDDSQPYFIVLEIGQIFPTHWMPLPEPPKGD